LQFSISLYEAAEGEQNQSISSAVVENENRQILNIFFLSSPQKKDGPNIAIRPANGKLQLPQALIVVTRHFNDSI